MALKTLNAEMTFINEGRLRCGAFSCIKITHPDFRRQTFSVFCNCKSQRFSHISNRRWELPPHKRGCFCLVFILHTTNFHVKARAQNRRLTIRTRLRCEYSGRKPPAPWAHWYQSWICRVPDSDNQTAALRETAPPLEYCDVSPLWILLAVDLRIAPVLFRKQPRQLRRHRFIFFDESGVRQERRSSGLPLNS